MAMVMGCCEELVKKRWNDKQGAIKCTKEQGLFNYEKLCMGSFPHFNDTSDGSAWRVCGTTTKFDSFTNV